MKRTIATMTAFAATLALATPTLAATLVINPILATWQSIVAGAPGTVTFSGQNTANASVSWGTPASGSGKSGYNFTAAPVPLNVAFVPNGATTAFTLGDFSHINRPIDAGTSITSAQLKITYGVFLDAVSLGNFDTLINFAHDETTNGANPCAYGGANGQGVNINGCADSVTPSLNLGGSQAFSIGGVDYLLNITGFTIGGNPATQFLTIEDAVNTAQLRGNISAKNLLPEPATWAMMLLGFGAIGAGMRRKQQAQTRVRFAF